MKPYYFLFAIFLVIVNSVYGAETVIERASKKPQKEMKLGLLRIGMTIEETSEVLGDRFHPLVNYNYEPEGFAKYDELTGMRLDFRRNRLWAVTLRPEFILSTPISLFREKQYNLPTNVQEMIHWGMPFSKFLKVMDSWVNELSKSGMELMYRLDEYNKRVESIILQKRQFSMVKVHPSQNSYWVDFGPTIDGTTPRIQWSFDFDHQTNRLNGIYVIDRNLKGLVLIK